MKTYRVYGPDGETDQVISNSKDGAAGRAAHLFRCRMFEVICYEETQP
jgi:hypothetical protein